eukprot:754933-Hanusia_phi.AAC.9
MQYVDGISLDELIEREGALESGEAIKVVLRAASSLWVTWQVQVAQDMIRALVSIHSAGFIYRDLKPQVCSLPCPA